MYDEFFAKAHELMEAGQPFVTATVVRAERPTSGKPGDKAIVTIDGVMHGWVGGSCAQPTVIQESLRALTDDTCRLIRLSTDPAKQIPRDGLLDMSMTCFSGGTLEIYIEPQRPKPPSRKSMKSARSRRWAMCRRRCAHGRSGANARASLSRPCWRKSSIRRSRTAMKCWCW